MAGITLREVAAKAGVSISTASAALNGLAIVKEPTRRRVEEAARELGYQPNAAAAILAAGHKRSRGAAGVRPTLGYLLGPTSAVRKPEAFIQRASGLGYDVECVEFGPDADPAREFRALWNRRVAGLFISTPSAVPAPDAWEDPFLWRHFAVVKFTRSRPALRFDLIRHSAFDYMAAAIRRVDTAGFERVALLLGGSAVAVDDEARLGAFLAWKALRKPARAPLEWCPLPASAKETDPPPKTVLSWLEKFRPEAVIGFPESVYWSLLASGLRIPGDFAYASVLVSPENTAISGCLSNQEESGRLAAELLDEKIKTGQLGMVETPRELVIEPLWNEGRTLPCPRKRKTAAGLKARQSRRKTQL